MLIAPLVLVTMLFVVQFSLAYYARTVVAGAAQDGAAAGARRDSSASAGATLADSLAEQGAGSLLTSHTASATSDGDVVSVTVEAKVVTLLPFVGPITVKASSSARVEEFEGQGAAP